MAEKRRMPTTSALLKKPQYCIKKKKKKSHYNPTDSNVLIVICHRTFIANTDNLWSRAILARGPLPCYEYILCEKQAKLIVMPVPLMFPAPLASGGTLPLNSEDIGSSPKQAHVLQ
ncbi:hypothetical protein AAES_114894 [Amazona aestiva]|uniref:Uncharacterized protein n=1 Tax=Amazona aestiva TaxID=12930 RepID=A0A0Q3TDC6_AMAAE|nr:hypothetical protein AAES_114894 [Amazona aestiva]